MQWISNNSAALSVLINAGMLAVWLFYAQLLLNSYRRSRRPKIIVDQGVGRGLKSYCLIANMSSEAVFVQVVVAALYNSEDRISRDITNLKVRARGENAEGQAGVSGIQAQTVQGPLQAGNYLDIGTFGEVIDAVLKEHGTSGEESREEQADRYSLELTVIATFGPENQPIGARRCFEFSRSDKGEQRVRPTKVDTERMSGIRDRKQMHRWLQQYL
ncbi:MAG: hypothetical protein WD382_11830 [Halofilum sp. (in: g-proteobacteria)]